MQLEARFIDVFVRCVGYSSSPFFLFSASLPVAPPRRPRSKDWLMFQPVSLAVFFFRLPAQLPKPILLDPRGPVRSRL
jgi:hypothetical protein